MSAIHLVIFEDSTWPDFAPLSIDRPLFLLRCGLYTLLERQIRRVQPARLTLWVRPELAELCRRQIVPALGVATTVNTPLDDQPALLSNARLMDLGDIGAASPAEFFVAVEKDQVICQAFAKSPGLSPHDLASGSEAWKCLFDLPRHPHPPRAAHYPWDLIYWNEEAIASDTALLDDRGDRMASLPTGPFHVIEAPNVRLHTSAKISPGVVLDASHGPIVIDAEASIGANCVIQGPCHIGRHCVITPLSLIRAGTSLGPMCKVGGEVSQTIFLGNSNKAHEGFIGHSYVGQWVNLGAGTTTSNLKNTYGSVSVQMGSRKLATGKQFLGSLIGDHTKTAIGTRLMTGSYIGYCSQLAAGGLPPKFIPSFTFWTDRGAEPYDLAKARQVMSQVYSRRNRTWNEADDELLKYARETSKSVET